MIERKKQFNSTLSNISKKRAAAIASGEYKPKARKPIRKVSAKMAKRITNYRRVCFATYGTRCFICGREMPESMLDCHHFFLRGNGDQCVFPLCRRGCGCGAHNHSGNDARLLEINKVIYNKLWIAGQARVINSRCRELHGVDYPTFHKNEKERRTKCQ